MTASDPTNSTSTKSKHVLMLLTNAFNPDPRVYQEAKSLLQNGYEVTILCWDRDLRAPPHELTDGIIAERIYVRSTHGRGTTQAPYLILFWLKALVRAFKKNYHVVHAHDFDTLPLGYILARLRRAKLVYDTHESYVDMLDANVNKYLKNSIIILENFLLKRVDYIITVGRVLAQTLENRGGTNVAVVGNWKDSSSYNMSSKDLAQLKKDLCIPKGKIVICYIGHLHPRRKITQLLDAVAAKEPFHCIIGGYGELSSTVKGYSNSFSNIRHLGYIKPKDVPTYTAVSDIIYSAFDITHPLARYIAPNKLFEALAAGKAVLTGNYGEVGRIVAEEDCGIVLDSYEPSAVNQALEELAANPDKLKSYSTKARAASQRYNWDVARKILLDVYSLLYSSSHSRF